MEMNVSKGEFDRRVKLLELKVRENNNNLLNRLQAEHDEFIKQLEEIDVTGLPDDFISDYNNFKANTLRINDVFDANGQFDGSKIRPLTVETGAITVGQRSQQLSLKDVYFSVNPYNRDTTSSPEYHGTITWTGGVMNHYGFGADGMTPKDYSIYVSDTTHNTGSFTLTSNGAYYIYAVFKRVTENYVSVAGISKEYFNSKNIALFYKENDNYISAENTEFDESKTYYLEKEVDDADIDTTAYILISQERIKINGMYGSPETEYNASTIPGSGYSSGQHCFYIQIGYISEELSRGNEGDNNRFYRKVDMTYGQTTINGRLITTGRIEGSTGSNPAYIDLDEGEIGGTFKLFTASTTTVDGESYVRSGMSGITDYPSLWAGGKLRHAEILANFRDAWYAAGGSSSYVYPATDFYPRTIPTEDTTEYPYKIHMYPYTVNQDGTRHYTSYTKLTFTEALKDADTTRPVEFQVPKAFIDYNGNAKFGKMYLDQQGGFFLGNIQLTTNGAWLNSLTSFIGTASIGDSTHHIYWNGSTFVPSSSSFLPLSGGTMTGNLVLKGGQYNREGALNCNNSDIINVNSILTADNAENFGEGLCFYRSASTWDCMSASNGTFYFGSNKAYSAAFVGDATINCGTLDSTNVYSTNVYSADVYSTNVYATGYVTALSSSSSDKRLKKEIKPFNAKQIIDKLSPVEFEWNKKANKYNSNLELNKKNYGLIAQDSDNIIDNLVFDLPDNKGYKGVRYEKLIPILLQAVKEQQKEIDELKRKIK